MLRAAFIMAALDAGVPLRDVQIAARHADPRTTTVYDHRRQNFDSSRQGNTVAAARAFSIVIHARWFGGVARRLSSIPMIATTSAHGS